MAVKISTPSYNKASALLTDGRLHEACDFLRNIHHTLSDTQAISDEAERLLSDLDRLLQHYAQGGTDPQREELYARIYDQAWQLCDRLYDVESPNTASMANLSSTIDALYADPNADQWLGTAFEQIAESRHLTREDRDTLNLALLDESLPLYVRASLMSATTLHLLQWFDAELIEAFYVFTFDDQPSQLRVQAWVTLVLAAIIHKDRIAHRTRLQEQYRLICESEPDLLLDLQTALLQCREAHDADKQIKEMASKLDVDDDKENIASNLKGLFAFITEGLDMSFDVFKKQARLPFFSAPGNRHHWLEPFSLEQPQMKALFDEHPQALPWVRMMSQSVSQCETDKYATVLTMQGMGGGQLMIAIGEKLEKTGLKFEDVIPLPTLYVLRNYLHDLYRYYRLHPKAKEMRYNPFDMDLKMCMNPWLRSVITDNEELDKIGELLIRKEHWAEAAQVYELMLKTEVNEHNLQQLAFAYCKSQAYNNASLALQPLRRCNRLYPGNKWTQKLMADILHENQEYVSEEETLHEALGYHTDDVSLLVRLGRCLNAQKRFAEAQEPLFKADILKEGQRSTQHELALSLFGTHDYDRASHYATLASNHSKAQPADKILCAHAALQRGDVTQALALYREASEGNAISALRQDRELLNDAGVDNLSIDLMCETLNATMEKNIAEG